ncbi:CidA/LrgA family protein [Flexilinea flocculi]|jgi:holin-like protein|uniref:Putative effector of murein hydrolase LrgA, UPF0299 family n=1 Tax=Flexilinea flocculi TaxID=1678840 RepID=A0A0S7BXP7_9CHLR|nr:CidA/LrgA family protein [Flexilinea flocculi]GAP41766.1 putative effector of murein hydrolase LrgA, UPF0299 family [Flexilinea flocculi]
MRYLRQIGIIFLICYISKIISTVIPAKFPSNVISMILLFLLLITKAIKPESIRDFSEFLLKNMAFFFIPSGVAIMDEIPFLLNKIHLILFILFITFVCSFWVTAIIVETMMKRIKGCEEVDHE